MKKLEGKVVQVIGGSRGIGAGIVRKMAEQGALVTFTYVSAGEKAIALKQEMEEKQGFCKPVQADSTDFAQMSAVIDQLVKQFGTIDVLVNSAGLFATGKIGDPAKDKHSIERMWAVNVRAVVQTVDMTAAVMADNGRIITIGSGAADRVPFAGVGDYAAGKAALAAYTRAWARDLADRNITVNIVQPGLIHTDLVPDDPAVIEEMIRPVPLGRLGTPDEIGNVVAFLAGTEASYITGATINVDGGLG